MAGMHDAPLISPENKDRVDEVIAALPKVDLHHHLDAAWDPETLNTPDALTQAVRAEVAALARDNVVYAEVRLTPEFYDHDGFDFSAVVDAAVAGLDVPGIDARVVLCAMTQTGRVDEVAQLAVKHHGKTVVGFDLAGDETAARPSAHATAFELLRANYVPFSVHAGARGGLEDIAEAVQMGATRIAHACAVIDDFSADVDGIVPGKVSGWICDRQIPIESAPNLEIALGVVDDLADHPLPLLQQLGFNCTVNSGNTPAGTLSEQFVVLAHTFGYGLEEFFDLTVKAIDAAFITQPERQHLLETVILPAYEELSDAELAGPDTPDSLALHADAPEAGTQ